MASYSRLPSGKWRVAVKYKGSRATATAATKSAVRVLGAQLLANLGARQNADTVPVGDLIDGHLARVEWSPTTLYDARLIADALPGTFSDRPVADVDGAVLAALYRQLSAAGWSPHRIRRAHFVISTAWAEAITWGWATSNPCRFVKLPKVRPRDIRPPDTAEVVKILTEADGVFLLFAVLAAVTGARRGELVALKWSDVDLDRAELWIGRSLVVVGGQPVTERDTKTSRKGHRMVPLDGQTVEVLARYRTDQEAKAAAAGITAVWVFSHDAGHTPWRPDHPSRLFRQARQRAGVTDVRLHDLRHYVATQMLHDGEPPVVVAGQLGHASVTTTLGVYAHQLPGRNRESVERRAARLTHGD